MSLFGAINTAVSGLTAQSTSFGNISEDVANSQTVGFKRVDTNFTDYLTTSTATTNVPGAVVASPEYVNNVQGTVTQTDNTLGMAIAGQGFFAVSQPTGVLNGVTTYNPQQFYTRAGDFTMNSTGFLVNSAGQYLNGWLVNSTTGVANQNALVPIQVNQSTYNPVATQDVTLSANLPATPASGTGVPAYIDSNGNYVAAAPISSQITVYDALGTAHAVTLNWTQVADPNSTSSPPTSLSNKWTVQVEVPDASATLGDGTTPNYTTAGFATVTFGNSTSTVPPAGTINSVVTTVPAAVTSTSQTSGSSGTASASITNNNDGTWTEIVDDGSGSATGTTTTTITVPNGAVPGSPGVPKQTVTTVATSSGTASNSTTRTVEADGTVVFVQTQDSGSTTTGTTITTTMIPPAAGTMTGSGSYDPTKSTQSAATLSFTTNFGSGNQAIKINLGTYGATTGVTQFAGSTYSLHGLTQDGVPPGSFSGVTVQNDGNVVVNYNNGQTRTIAQIPIITFNAPNALQSQNGQSFTATPESGSPLAVAASTNGAGDLVVGSIEGSNVDIATEFSNLIVAQQAYSANSKVVTTANQMLQVTLTMIT